MVVTWEKFYMHLELRYEIRVVFFHKTDLSKHFCDVEFLATLAYLADIFEKLNSLNRSSQEKNLNFLETHNKVEAFMKKLALEKLY